MTAQAHTSLSTSVLSLFAAYVAEHADNFLHTFGVVVSIAAGLISIAYTLHKWHKGD